LNDIGKKIQIPFTAIPCEKKSMFFSNKYGLIVYAGRCPKINGISELFSIMFIAKSDNEAVEKVKISANKRKKVTQKEKTMV